MIRLVPGQKLSEDITLLQEIPPKFVAKSGYYLRQIQCLCSCGQIFECPLNYVRSGDTKSCGCLKRRKMAEVCLQWNSARDQGMIRHWLYGRWRSMNRRCHSPRDKAYPQYGAKGISVCDEWLNNFWAFVVWIENVERMCKHFPFDVHRRNSKGNYSPDNCVCLAPEDHTFVHFGFAP